VAPLNTLLAMSESTKVLAQKRAVELRDAVSQILFILVRMAVILLVAAFVIARLIVAFAVLEFKAHWPRGRMSHTQ
jgi:hypothetical protein